MEVIEKVKIKADLKNRTILDDGTVILHDNAVLDLLHRSTSPSLDEVIVLDSEDVKEYNKLSNLFGYDEINTNIIAPKSNINNWYIPEEYKELDIEHYLVDKCDNDTQRMRVATELVLFKERDMYPLLQYLVYLSHIIKEKNVLCGIGRGSSVSSYCLYLIGIHKVDSLKYNLDINEFLK